MIKILMIGLMTASFYAQAVEMSLRDEEYKKAHLAKLGPKKGYQGTKDWDNFIPMAIKYEDSEVLRKMLSVETSPNPTENSQYIYDLYSVYKEKPVFFVETAYSFYKKNLNCVVRILKTNPMILKTDELESPFKMTSSSKTFNKFIEAVNKLDYSKEPLKETIKHTRTCAVLKKSKH